MNPQEGIVTRSGPKQGKTLAIFAGIHGNEMAGVLALRKATNELSIESGTVTFVFANPPAIEKDVREIDRNLNRIFMRNLNDSSWEYTRANELMDILDESDSLLDLHASNSRITKPFAICDERSFNLAKNINIEIVSSGWNELVPGSTDAYMSAQGKISLGLECGSVFETEANVPLAFDSICQFLQYFGAISNRVTPYANKQLYLKAAREITKQTIFFAFAKNFNDFDPLEEGSIFAQDGDISYKAGKDEYIVFPRPDKPVGGEACTILKKL